MSMKALATARNNHNKFKMKCIVPNEENVMCAKDPIKSHSIQHNGILSRLSVDGIVYCLGETTKGDEIFKYDLKSKGINQEASIFKCLCKEHDDLLFADIEKKAFCKQPKQCFQFALKALLHSYWTKCNDTAIVNKVKQKAQISELITEDKKAYSDELNHFWEIYHTEQYHELLNYIITIDREVNSAVSTSINVYRKFDGSLFGNENDDNPLLHISIFPSENKSYILISALKKDEPYFRAFTQQFAMLSVKDILNLLNIIIPLLAQNIMISPRIINNMTTKEKKELLTIFKIETLDFYYQQGIHIDNWSKQISYNLW